MCQTPRHADDFTTLHFVIGKMGTKTGPRYLLGLCEERTGNVPRTGPDSSQALKQCSYFQQDSLILITIRLLSCICMLERTSRIEENTEGKRRMSKERNSSGNYFKILSQRMAALAFN